MALRVFGRMVLQKMYALCETSSGDAADDGEVTCMRCTPMGPIGLIKVQTDTKSLYFSRQDLLVEVGQIIY